MGPIIGKSTVVPHVIKRVRIIGEVGIMVDGMLGHLLLFNVGFVERRSY